MNKRLAWALIAAIAAGAGIGAARAEARERLAMATAEPARLTAGRTTLAPIGYVRFCAANPTECGGPPGRSGTVTLDASSLAQLREVNATVNAQIKPLTDIEHYGEVERWSYPDDGYGDCEDYVLLKRRTLIALGWPREALLITVVRDRQGEGHSVLTVTTDQGDLILDNQESEILLWSETGYRFVKRQSQTDPGAWVALGDMLAPPVVGRN